MRRPQVRGERGQHRHHHEDEAVASERGKNDVAVAHVLREGDRAGDDEDVGEDVERGAAEDVSGEASCAGRGRRAEEDHRRARGERCERVAGDVERDPRERAPRDDHGDRDAEACGRNGEPPAEQDRGRDDEDRGDRDVRLAALAHRHRLQVGHEGEREEERDARCLPDRRGIDRDLEEREEDQGRGYSCRRRDVGEESSRHTADQGFVHGFWSVGELKRGRPTCGRSRFKLGCQSQRQSAPAPTTSATRAARATAPLRSVAASDTRAYHRITRSSPPRRCPQISPVSLSASSFIRYTMHPHKGGRTGVGSRSYRLHSKRSAGACRHRGSGPRRDRTSWISPSANRRRHRRRARREPRVPSSP